MKEKLDSEDRTTKARRIPGKITKKLGQRKEVYRNSIRKHEKAV